MNTKQYTKTLISDNDDSFCFSKTESDVTMSGEVKLETMGDHHVMSGVQGGQAPVPVSDINQRHSHSDDDSGCALEEYTWVPPGLKPDQVIISK